MQICPGRVLVLVAAESFVESGCYRRVPAEGGEVPCSRCQRGIPTMPYSDDCLALIVTLCFAATVFVFFRRGSRLAALRVWSSSSTEEIP